MVNFDDIVAAKRRLAGHLVVTPCTPSGAFDDLFAGHPWFKFENLQRTGSFKERGALNRIMALTPEERKRGIIAASAGNHAQGVAYHAGRLGVPATIVMPERSPLIKVTNTRRHGARVVLHGTNYDEAMEEALRLRDEDQLTLVHPFDDPAVIAGQGTAGLEILEQCPELDVVIVAVGGGGLISGIAMAVKQSRPDVRIIGVEAANLPAAYRAREAGQLVKIPAGETIADGISVRRVGEETFPLIERYVDELVLVEEEEIASAVLLLLEREKTVVEPAAATPLAAAISGRIDGLEDKNVVMVLSGGNIDVNLLSRIIDRGLMNDGRLTQLDVRVQDRPGALAGLATLLAACGANVLKLDHNRGTHGLWLTDVEIALTLETRGREHVQEIVERLTAASYEVHQN